MGKITFLQLAERVLREEGRPLSPAEMWEVARSKNYDKLLDTTGKTPAATLYSVVFTNTRNDPATIFVKIGERPARYFLKELIESIRPDVLERVQPTEDVVPQLPEYSELDLHPFLTYFAQIYFKAFTKTIRHQTSKKKEFGEWVHPDMVGIYYPVADWKPEVLDLSAATGNTTIKVYSFELKKSLSFTNLRESFFQTVSNSSWANESYLVSAKIYPDEDFLSELRRLSGSFGIGVIRLSIEDPDSSEILFPAKERETLDWDTINKLTFNKDFTELLIRIKNDLQTKEIIKEKYDEVFSKSELMKRIKKKQK
jgi:hypothetical protein